MSRSTDHTISITRKGGAMLRRSIVAAAVAVAGLGVAAASSQAELRAVPEGTSGLLSSPQAGAHSDIHVGFRLATGDDLVPTGMAKTIVTDMPDGFLGNAAAIPQCTAAQAMDQFGARGPCPRNTIVGVADVGLSFGPGIPEDKHRYFVYNIKPYADQPAALLIPVMASIPVRLDMSVGRNGRYNIQATIRRVSEGYPVISTDVTLWGVPADNQGPGAESNVYGDSYGGPLSGAQRRPFLTNPTVCDGNPLRTTFTFSAWIPQTPSTVSTVGESPATTGCEKLRFEPSIEVRPASSQAGVPSAYDVELKVPQSDAADGLGTPPLKDATVVLPAGVAISPPSADGLAACSDAQVALRSSDAEQCPDAAKIGTVRIDTPLLGTPLTGSAYLGSQESHDPRSGRMFRIFLVAAGSGVRIKLEGALRVDPASGQVTASFLDNPQLPFSRLLVSFKGGNRAPLINPATCGEKTATATLSSWGGPSASASDSFAIDSGCDTSGRFEPTFAAGIDNPVAGGSSSFTLDISRPDGQQDLGGVDVALPPGLLGDVGSVPLCAESRAVAGTCGAESRVGRVSVAAGTGVQALAVPQAGKAPTSVSLAGPYKGAPFSLSIVVPAQAGPFDLGTVVVRAALFIDRNDTHVTVNSDPLPTIVGGVPLRMQKVAITLDRPGFMVNSTNCSPARISGQVRSAQGAAVKTGSRFQVGDCGTLPFTPKMTLRVGAKGKLTRGKRTPLEVTLTMSRGQANNRSVEVTLPKALNSRLDVVNKRNACTLDQFRADACPNPVGTAVAVTPLLRDPLSGPAYFVYSPDRRLPDLVVRLKGQVAVDLVGKVVITRDLRLRTTFDMVPDVPITKFRLALASGARNGPIGTTGDLCPRATRTSLRAGLGFVAQSNRRVSREQTIAVVGCGGARAPAKKGVATTKR